MSLRLINARPTVRVILKREVQDTVLATECQNALRQSCVANPMDKAPKWPSGNPKIFAHLGMQRHTEHAKTR